MPFWNYFRIYPQFLYCHFITMFQKNILRLLWVGLGYESILHNDRGDQISLAYRQLKVKNWPEYTNLLDILRNCRMFYFNFFYLFVYGGCKLQHIFKINWKFKTLTWIENQSPLEALFTIFSSICIPISVIITSRRCTCYLSLWKIFL